VTPDFKATLEEALAGTTVEAPKDLSELIGYVDGRQKLIINYEELHESLEALVKSGQVRQVDDRYCLASGDSAPSVPFRGFSYEAYRTAEQQYRKRFWKEYKELRRRDP